MYNHFRVFYYVQLENRKEINEFLDLAKPPKLNQKSQQLKQTHTNEEIEILVKSLPAKKSRAGWIQSKILLDFLRSIANPF